MSMLSWVCSLPVHRGACLSHDNDLPHHHCSPCAPPPPPPPPSRSPGWDSLSRIDDKSLNAILDVAKDYQTEYASHAYTSLKPAEIDTSVLMSERFMRTAAAGVHRNRKAAAAKVVWTLGSPCIFDQVHHLLRGGRAPSRQPRHVHPGCGLEGVPGVPRRA